MSDRTIKHQPFELLSEQVADEAMLRIRELGAPEAILRLLPGILQEVFHDGVETGLGLADSNDINGPAEIFEVYTLGVSHGKDLT
jgi:hypothetical protein